MSASKIWRDHGEYDEDSGLIGYVAMKAGWSAPLARREGI
jgi:hypothetical protein